MSFVFFKGTRLADAIARGDIQAVTALLDKGVSPNIDFESYLGFPLMLAIAHRKRDIALLLIDRGAAVERTCRGENCLQKAVSRDMPEVALRLIEKDPALLNRLDGDRCTILHTAAEKGYTDVVKCILDKNPSLLEVRNYYGTTALHCAAAAGYADIVAVLLARGADPNVKNNEQRTALFYAQTKNLKNVEALLLPVTAPEAGALPPPATPQPGWTKLSDQRIAHAVVDAEIGYCITDIFNFQARDRIRIVQNLETKSETMETKNFVEIRDKASLEEALAELNRQGGKAHPGSISGLMKDF